MFAALPPRGFWQPSAVICDTDTLITLPAREYRSGLGELAKYHFLGGGDLDRATLPERVLRLTANRRSVSQDAPRNATRSSVHRPRVRGSVGVHEPFVAHLGVHLRGRHRNMPQQLLDHA